MSGRASVFRSQEASNLQRRICGGMCLPFISCAFEIRTAQQFLRDSTHGFLSKCFLPAESMGSPVFISKPPPGFSFFSVVRGVQLSFVGLYRSLQNPDLYNEKYYNQALQALKISLLVQVVLYIPLIVTRLLFGFLALFMISHERANSIYSTISYIQHDVLNIGPFVIMSIRFLRPELDQMFMTSLEYADTVHKRKHPGSERLYHAPLVTVPSRSGQGSGAFFRLLRLLKSVFGSSLASVRRTEEFEALVWTYIMYAASSVWISLLAKFPLIGRLVLPVLSFLKFNGFVGTTTALVIFAVLLMAPPQYGALFLSSYYGSRALVLDLLSPYLSRMPFTKIERLQWIAVREGVLYGFGLSFYFLLKVPFVGVLVYGLAEASAAYMITKVTDPYPSPKERNSVSTAQWIDTQIVWTKKFEELSVRSDSPLPVPGEFIASPQPSRPLSQSIDN